MTNSVRTARPEHASPPSLVAQANCRYLAADTAAAVLSRVTTRPSELNACILLMRRASLARCRERRGTEQGEGRPAREQQATWEKLVSHTDRTGTCSDLRAPALDFGIQRYR